MTDDLAELDAIISRLVTFREKIGTGAEAEPAADPLAAAVADLREECLQRRIPIVEYEGDHWVDGKGAAKLVGKSEFTVRNWRGPRRIPCTKIGITFHYRLEDIAKYKLGEGP